jgi:hypothetical protein
MAASLVIVAASLLAAGSSLGAIIYSATQLYTPAAPSSPPALSIYLGSLLLSLSLQSAWWWASPQAKGRAWVAHPLSRGACAARCRLLGLAAVLVASPLLVVLYAVGYRVDGASWSASLFITALLLAAGMRRAATGHGSAAADTCASRLAPAAAEQDGGEGSINNGGYSPVAADAEEKAGNEGDGLFVAGGGLRASLGACCCPPRSAPRLARALFLLHGLLFSTTVVTLVLLLGGAGTIAWGWRTFTPRGTLYPLILADGTVQTVLGLCLGPPANTTGRPTVWLEVGGGGHSTSDVWGLMETLAARGQRVCSYDPPGTGWSRLSVPLSGGADSGPVFVDIATRLQDSMGESGPFVLAGTMDGAAARILELALAHPERAAALIPMQYGPGEFYTNMVFHNQTPAQAAPAAVAALAARVGLADVIRFLAVHWGLMPLFVSPSPTFVPEGRQLECHFLNLFHEGQWDMQARVLAAQVRDPYSSVLLPDVWAVRGELLASLDRPPPVRALANTPPDLPGECASAQMDPASPACALLLFSLTSSRDYMAAMASITNGSRLEDFRCGGGPTNGGCADWLGGGSTVPWVADRILEVVGNVTAAGRGR